MFINNSRFSINNCILIIWYLINLCVINDIYIGISNLYYLVWITAIICLIINAEHKYNTYESRFILMFFALAGVQILGCLNNFTVFAVKNVISTIMTLVLLVTIFFVSTFKRSIMYSLPYFLVLMIALCMTIGGQRLGNTIPACIVFLTSSYLLMNYKYSFKNGRSVANKQKKILGFIFRAMPICITLYVSFISESRTAISVFLLILCFYLFFRYIKADKTFLKKSFYYALALITILLIIYSNFDKILLFEDFNYYSTIYFHKNIHSGREYIWSYTLSNMKWWQFIIGAGTGSLPAISEYADSSFHNTFIQLFVQNGLIGLLIFLFILKSIWGIIIDNNSIFIARISISMFIAIIIYNCFECTLIANKAFLGSIQWLLLSIAAKKNE